MKFSFGRNWLSYSESALTPERVEVARRAFQDLTTGIELQQRRFLDVGFGQGLALFLAAEAGAQVLGVDNDAGCAEALRQTHRFFPSQSLPDIRTASILDQSFLMRAEVRAGFDVVHSWGALHHSGHLWQALNNAASLVRPGGFLIVSIYNRHWTSPMWRLIKKIFHHSPAVAQRLFIRLGYPLFAWRRRTVAGHDGHHDRGMDTLHDTMDWLGGYPYEYARPNEIIRFVEDRRFKSIRFQPTSGFTGCNEFVFRSMPPDHRRTNELQATAS